MFMMQTSFMSVQSVQSLQTMTWNHCLLTQGQ